MHNTRCCVPVGLLFFAITTNSFADKTGIAVGAKAPEFKLRDQSGKVVALSELVKKSQVAIVFHRSADW